MGTETPSSLDHNATIDRMEPGIAPVDTILAINSMAVSMKRIADSLDMIRSEVGSIGYHVSEIQQILRNGKY